MDTIKSSADISYVFSHGTRIHTSFITMLVVPRQRGRSDEECGRVAFVAGKRLGNAVWRNAAKRRMRAICREVGGPWNGFDVVFLAKSGITSAPYGKVLDASLKAVSRSPLCDAAPRED